MASEPYEPRFARVPHPGPNGRAHGVPEPSLGELLRRLSDDTGELVRQEVLLAKAEVRRTGATLARDGAKVGVAIGLALAGTLALGAFAVLALGQLLDNYWLAALLVGVVLLGLAYVLGNAAVADVKRRGIGVPQTADTLREDAAWARREMREVKRELTARPRGD
ncbi:MAG: phage holin family protein [Gemmatirosa sp.]